MPSSPVFVCVCVVCVCVYVCTSGRLFNRYLDMCERVACAGACAGVGVRVWVCGGRRESE